MTDLIDNIDFFVATPHAEQPAWMNEYFSEISRNLERAMLVTLCEPIHIEPTRVYDGLVVFADGVDWNPSNGRGIYYYDSVEADWVFVGFNTRSSGISPLAWRNLWQQDNYVQGDIVRDGTWLMIANKDTSSRAAPVPQGAPSTSLPDVPAFVTKSQPAIIYSGHKYIFTTGGWITELRAWVPQITANISYRILFIDETIPEFPITTIIDDPVLLENGWKTVSLGQRLVPTGTVIRVILESLNSGANTEVTGGWRYGGASNADAPATQSWNHRTQQDVLRISKTDLDSVDRTTELQGIITGSTIAFSVTATPEDFIQYRTSGAPIDQGSYFEYSVTFVDSGGTLTFDDDTTMLASIPIADATEYVDVTDQWIANQPTWATVTGELQYDGVEQPNNENNAFGVDIEFQPALVSPDWDVMARTEL